IPTTDVPALGLPVAVRLLDAIASQVVARPRGLSERVDPLHDLAQVVTNLALQLLGRRGPKRPARMLLHRDGQLPHAVHRAAEIDAERSLDLGLRDPERLRARRV